MYDKSILAEGLALSTGKGGGAPNIIRRGSLGLSHHQKSEARSIEIAKQEGDPPKDSKTGNDYPFKVYKNKREKGKNAVLRGSFPKNGE